MGENNKEWDWRRMIPSSEYHALAHIEFPGWDKIGKVPHSVRLEHIHGEGKSSREIAIEWDDLTTGCFYYRDITQSGLPILGRGEQYASSFVFQFEEDATKFKSLFGRYIID